MMLWGRHATIRSGRGAADHCHDLHELVVCLDSLGVHTLGTERYPFHPGRTFLIPGGLAHRVIPPSQGATSIIFVCFSSVTLAEAGSTLLLETLERVIVSKSLVGGVEDTRLLKQNLAFAYELVAHLANVDILSRLRAGALVTQLLANHVASIGQTSSPQTDHWRERLASLCHELQREPCRPWSVDEAARSCAMSRALFTRRFREFTGYSFVRYLTITRIHRAMRLLETTSLEMAEIATSSGFTNLSYFYRSFRSLVGLAPGRYRRRVQLSGSPLPLLPELKTSSLSSRPDFC
ncbi:MAG: AraC family transcriptional regulator [Lentisphaerae bacterium]|nr:MAG: AraC family transcriptional regulator [Lentisphaerota bacterium]